MTRKLPYGLCDGKLLHIDQVKGGLDCNCVCPACNSQLLARKGEKNIHHFAHFNNPECKHGLQTALHLAAKEILLNEKIFRLPARNIPIDSVFKNEVFQGDPMCILRGQSHYELFPSRIITISQVTLEKCVNDFVPDIILECEGRTLLVEIAVTHFVDQAKKKKIERSGISSVEIDLSSYTSEFGVQSLRDVLINNFDLKSWIYNAREAVLWENAKSILQKENLIELEKEREKEKDRIRKQNEHLEAIRQQKERDRKAQEENNQKREEEYKKHYKLIIERFCTSKYNGEKFPALHVEPCPINKRKYNGVSYANAWTDCQQCRYFRGFRPDEANSELAYVICLGDYYLKKMANYPFVTVPKPRNSRM